MKTPDGPQTPPDEGAKPEETEIERLRRENAEFTAANNAASETAEKEAEAAAETEKPAKTGRFDPEKLSHKNDPEFLAVADVTVPKTSATWQHPKNDKIVFCYGLAQMIVDKDLNLKKTSRDVVLEWIYVRMWRPLSLGELCKNVESASAILKVFMVLPRRTAIQVIQKTIINAGRKQIGSPGAAGADGTFGGKTHGAIYSELCKHYVQTERALYAQVYGEFQEYAGKSPELWVPVLQAWATDRL